MCTIFPACRSVNLTLRNKKCNTTTNPLFPSSLHSIAPSSGGPVSLPLHSSLSFQHEAVQAELREKQEDMDQLISTVEDLQRELEKVPKSDPCSIQREMETLRDQWLEVSAT